MREEQALELYRRYRTLDQRDWYERRCAEFRRAVDQLSGVSAAVLALGALSAALAAQGGHATWAVFAVVFPAIATAASAFGSLYAFEQQSKLYADAARSLRSIERGAPANPDQAAVAAYVAQVEDVLRREQGQWGQLVTEVRGADDAS